MSVPGREGAVGTGLPRCFESNRQRRSGGTGNNSERKSPKAEQEETYKQALGFWACAAAARMASQKGGVQTKFGGKKLGQTENDIDAIKNIIGEKTNSGKQRTGRRLANRRKNTGSKGKDGKNPENCDRKIVKKRAQRKSSGRKDLLTPTRGGANWVSKSTGKKEKNREKRRHHGTGKARKSRNGQATK